jgi:hypothetical protein
MSASSKDQKETKDGYTTDQKDAQTDRQDMENNQTSMLGSDGGVNVTQMAGDIQGQVPAHDPDPSGMGAEQSTMDQFAADAPDNLAFDLPFGLGKLFNLPGEKQKEAQEQANASAHVTLSSKDHGCSASDSDSSSTSKSP